MNFENIPNNENSLKEKYRDRADQDGFLSVGVFSTTELGKQSKSIAAFLDGDGGTNDEINFGRDFDIKYTGNSGNYSNMKIHIDDLDKFVEEIKKYYGD